MKPKTPQKRDRVKVRNRTDITADKIIATAAAQIREQGMHHFSMHQLAAELNVTATTIYYYFDNKKDLLVATASHIMQSQPVLGKKTPWKKRLKQFLIDNQALLLEYPGLALFLVKNRDSEPGLIWIEKTSEILLDGGFQGKAATSALSILSFFINPMTFIDEKDVNHTSSSILRPEHLSSIHAENPGKYPAMEKLLPHISGATYSTQYENSIDRIIDSIATTVENSPD